MERSRTEWLRHLEIFHTDLEKDDSAFAIHRMSLQFGPPAKIDDLLIVRTRLNKLTGARSFLRQEVLRRDADGNEIMLCGADVEVAFINHGGGAKRFPDDLREKLGG
ncbi:MAG: hotdog domain-containing protein, partial [Pseudomonadota bacterium]